MTYAGTFATHSATPTKGFDPEGHMRWSGCSLRATRLELAARADLAFRSEAERCEDYSGTPHAVPGHRLVTCSPAGHSQLRHRNADPDRFRRIRGALAAVSLPCDRQVPCVDFSASVGRRTFLLL